MSTVIHKVQEERKSWSNSTPEVKRREVSSVPLPLMYFAMTYWGFLPHMFCCPLVALKTYRYRGEYSNLLRDVVCLCALEYLRAVSTYFKEQAYNLATQGLPFKFESQGQVNLLKELGARSAILVPVFVDRSHNWCRRRPLLRWRSRLHKQWAGGRDWKPAGGAVRYKLLAPNSSTPSRGNTLPCHERCPWYSNTLFPTYKWNADDCFYIYFADAERVYVDAKQVCPFEIVFMLMLIPRLLWVQHAKWKWNLCYQVFDI